MANNFATRVADSYFFRTNPVISKLAGVQDTDADVSCTYAGIARKLLYFMGMVVIGIVLCMILSYIPAGGAAFTEEGMPISAVGSAVLIVTFIMFLISPFLAVFIRPTIPVTGAMFCFSTGYVMTWAAMTFGQEYRSSILLAVILTMIIVSTLGFMYFTGKVRVTEQLRTVLTSLILCSFLTGFVVFILALIPATRPFVTSLRANMLINIGGSVLYVIIASLFLLVDFDTIRRAVDDGLPKKYEWWASFGLAFSVIWLFFKILELLSKLKRFNKK